jgi:DNA-directed RNA polymerase beta subunit
MSEKTLYVYSPGTGEIQYTIHNPTPSQINEVQFGHLDDYGLSILEMSVIANTTTNQTEMVKLKDMEDHVVLSDSQFVANGTHTIIVSNLHPKTNIIFCGRESSHIASFELLENVTAFEINNSMLNAVQCEDAIKFTIYDPGCKPKDYYIPIVKPPGN